MQPKDTATAWLPCPHTPAVPIAACRHQAAPLVCKQWHEVVHSPSLLRHVNGLTFATAEQLASFGKRAARAAGHLQHLGCTFGLEYDQRTLRGLEWQELWSCADPVLQQCTHLTALHVHVMDSLSVGEWVLQLQRLQTLRILGKGFRSCIDVEVPLHGLASLEALELRLVRGHIRPPSSLTALKVTRPWQDFTLTLPVSCVHAVFSAIEMDRFSFCALLFRLPCRPPAATNCRACSWMNLIGNHPGETSSSFKSPASLPSRT